MAENPEIVSPKVGMILDKHPSDLSAGQFSLLVNGNIQSSDGSFLMVSNEPSNLLCSRFKDGYKVIGIQPINTQNKTLFFLVNPDTNNSEIGIIDNTYYEDAHDKVANCKDCNNPIIEPSPLEDIDQIPLCTYTTLVNATCLNFNINYPISSEYTEVIDVSTGLSACVTTVFFTDRLNPRRFVELENIPYTIVGYDDANCNQPIYSTQLDCAKIRVIRDYIQPCTSTVDIIAGGNNKAGVYQFTAQYCTVNGNPLTSYFTVTNPVSLFDKNRVITIATDYPISQSIKVNISNLDPEFWYLKLVVIKTINQTTSVFEVGIFPTSNLHNFTYTYTGDNYQNEKRLTIEDIIAKLPIYEYAKGVCKANDHLFWWNLKEQREINLQPVINNLSIQWATEEVNEGFYSLPVSSNYVGYERDEVYPFSIYFKLANGFQTADFLISNHDATWYLQNTGQNVNTLTPSGNLNVLTTSNCSGTIRNKEWQIYDTSTVSASACFGSTSNSGTRCKTIEHDCYPEVAWATEDGTFYNSPCGNVETTFNLLACNTGRLIDNSCLFYFLQTLTNPSIKSYTAIVENTGQVTNCGSFSRNFYRLHCHYVIEYDCVVEEPSNCDIKPDKYGEFQYWESSLNYPSNPDIWGELCGKPIRYHKFPSNSTTHIHDSPANNTFATTNKIYPIGIRLNIQDVKSQLQKAVTQGLISQEELSQIVGFGIKRGNRRSSKSIIAKGLLYDVWNTPFLDGNGNPDGSNVYFPNFPFNDLTLNKFISTNGNDLSFSPSNRYTFHSPNTSFNKPFLGTEIKLETIEYGKSRGQFNYVQRHSEYILLNNTAYTLADLLAGLEAALDLAIVLGTSFAGAGSVLSFPVATGFSAGVGAAEGLFQIAGGFVKYQQQWIDIFTKLGTYRNPAAVYSAVGNYSNYCLVPNTSSITFQSALNNSFYLNPGNTQFTENGTSVYFNNDRRESSVYLSTVNTFLSTSNSAFGCNVVDNSRDLQTNNNTPGLSVNIDRNISSFYVSIRNYIPDQYGTPDQIDWIDTGYCGILDWTSDQSDSLCSTIYGGDTFINKFALKRKYPFFIQDRVGYGPQAPVQYSHLNNIGISRFFFDTEYDVNILNLTSPPVNMLNDSGSFYHKGFIPLYMYGIPYYFCESDYNIDLRHGEDNLAKSFYPYSGDVYNWTQEYLVPIFNDNYYFYNQDYSKQNRENFSYTLENSFQNSLVICRSEKPNRAIYSPEGTKNWLTYLGSDYYDFPYTDGKLIGLSGTEQGRVVVRQENSTKVFNAYITQNTSLQTLQISIGDMFATKPQEFYRTSLGFGGSTNVAFESTPYGHFWVDTGNPSVMQLSSNSLIDITAPRNGEQKVKDWFRKFLPFSILKDFPDIDIDNAYKYFGIATTWDNKFDRLFITKRDAQVLPEFKTKITYNAQNFTFYYNDNPVFPTDPTYFCDKSWTIAYSPIIQEFVSFYTFKPNYYNSTETYFQSGINYPIDNQSSEIGVWSHLLTNKSYTVFYGKKNPFIFEFSTKGEPNNSQLHSIKYSAETRIYQDNLNFRAILNKTYDSALVYNQSQSSGLLNLIPKEKNNLYQQLQYPKINQFSTDILVENVSYYWNFNGFTDISHNNGQPLMQYTCGLPYKDININSIDYKPKYLQNKFRNDYFVIRLMDLTQSQYQFINKYEIINKNPSTS